MEVIKSINVKFDPEEREAIDRVAGLLEMLCDSSGECQGCPIESHCRQRCATPLYNVLYSILSEEEEGDLGSESHLV